MSTSRPAIAERIGFVPLACVIGAVLVVASSALVWNLSPYWGRDDSPAAAATGVGDVRAGSAKYTLSVAPNRVVIPRLKAKAPIVDVATGAGRELQIPRDPRVVGWWKPGARPGARTGTAVLAGHVNFNGVTGTLSAIGKLRPGDRVNVYGRTAGNRKRVAFAVTGVRTYHKTALPFREIFDQKAAGRLALITCGGPFDASTGNYLDNVVVYAVPVGSGAA